MAFAHLIFFVYPLLGDCDKRFVAYSACRYGDVVVFHVSVMSNE